MANMIFQAFGEDNMSVAIYQIGARKYRLILRDNDSGNAVEFREGNNLDVLLAHAAKCIAA